MSASAGPGRPPGVSEATLERGRRYSDLSDYGVTAEQIAEREGVSRSDVYRAIRLVRPLAAAPEASSRPQAEPRRPRKMSAGALLYRAWLAQREVRAFELLGAEGREFWVNALMEIRGASDDGVSLTFGPGSPYLSRAEFLDVFRRTGADLDVLLARGMLLDLDGAGVAIPFRFGLRRDPLPAPPMPKRGAFEVVRGGRSESEKTRIYSDSESEETPIYSDSPGGVYSDSAAIYSDSSRALSLSPSSSTSFSVPLESPEESKEGSKQESESAPASASPNKLPPSPNKPPPASPNKSSAGVSDKEAPRTRLREDWQPPEGVLVEIRASGREVEPIVRHFRRHYLGRGTTRADWDATFETWWLRQPMFEPAEASEVIVVGRARKPDKGAFIRNQVREMATRRGIRPADDGLPIIDGEAEVSG